jgi:hypothetical protein
MRILLTAAIAGLMFISFAAFARAASFDDVPDSHWAYDAVEYLKDKGLVEGYPDGTFQGDKMLTRYEFAMVVARIYAKAEDLEENGEEMSIDTEALLNDLMEEFDPELAEIRDLVKANSVKIDELEKKLKENSEQDAKTAEKLATLGKFKFNGTLKLRADGKYWNPGDKKQHRPRVSFRFDMKAPVNDEITFGARLATGGVGANVASEQTLTDEFGIKQFDLERAFVTWKPKAWPSWTFWGGKFKPVWETPSNFIDPDVNVEGVAAVYQPEENWGFNISAMTPEDKGGYVVGQVGATDLFTDNLDLYLTYHYASSGAFETLWMDFPYWFRVTGDDYSAIEGFGRYKFDWTKDWPVFLEAAYRLNLADDAPGAISGLKQAAMAQVTVGEIKEVHDCNFFLNYGRVLPNAILPQFAHSTYGVDHQTFGVGFGYKPMEHTQFRFEYVNCDNLLTDPSASWDYWVADLIFDF